MAVGRRAGRGGTGFRGGPAALDSVAADLVRARGTDRAGQPEDPLAGFAGEDHLSSADASTQDLRAREDQLARRRERTEARPFTETATSQRLVVEDPCARRAKLRERPACGRHA